MTIVLTDPGVFSDVLVAQAAVILTAANVAGMALIDHLFPRRRQPLPARRARAGGAR